MLNVMVYLCFKLYLLMMLSEHSEMNHLLQLFVYK